MKLNFTNQKSNKYDRIFMDYFIASLFLDIFYNDFFNFDLELPCYSSPFFTSSKKKLSKKDLIFVGNFVKKYKGKLKNFKEIRQTIKQEFQLSDCDLTSLNNLNNDYTKQTI